MIKTKDNEFENEFKRRLKEYFLMTAVLNAKRRHYNEEVLNENDLISFIDVTMGDDILEEVREL